MRKLLGMTLILTLALLVACVQPGPAAQPQAPEQEPVQEPKEEAVPAEAGVSGTIRVGTWESDALALDLWDEIIASYTEENPDVDVKLEAVPDAYEDKLLVQIAAGEAPDIFQVGDGSVAKFIQREAVQPLHPYITGDNPLDQSQFFPNVLAIGQQGETTYLLPKDYSPLLVYYNKHLFDEAGVDYPQDGWTYEEFLATARALTVDENGDGEIDRWGVQLPASWDRAVMPFVFAHGGTTINADGTQATGHMNSPETVEAIEFYVDLYREHHVAPTPEEMQAYAGVDLFQSGLVAMWWHGRWPLRDFIENPELNFGTVGLPEADKAANTICWAGFGLYSGSDNEGAAWDFLKYLAAGDGAQVFARHAFTAVQPIAEAQGLSEDEYNAPIVDDLENVMPPPDLTTPFYGECVGSKFSQAIEQLLIEGGDVQQVLDDAAAQADDCLATK